ncbi:MAG: hypothetical protein UU48_C0015G0016 [Candidatus Uhrbacteria bacterium GW2011_GWF2_41_16]|uniref:Uncharacterized protein n=2 Tax=Candidatus Uhriibacteriota TaxID=1752732 RepID=A0A0G0XKZ1_9BACT|nr:MAG: hypothetical protein UU35_C0016G0016 [Candidatus Uhrbacteria bacterium GW2011_GWC2_41_11]KKR97440.1 MAG: hypothetical protein UU48_C0015G0016 [Candidatus Uhrbacteria bacterium GW2011_GWF2_41_16]
MEGKIRQEREVSASPEMRPRRVDGMLEAIKQHQKNVQPGSKHGRFLGYMGLLTGLLTLAGPREAQAEWTSWYAKKAESLERDMAKFEDQLRQNIAGSEMFRDEAKGKLRMLREGWREERREDWKFVDLSKEIPGEVQAYFTRYDIHVGTSTVTRPEPREYKFQWEHRMKTVTKEVANRLVLPHGKEIVCDLSVFKVQYQSVGENRLDILAFHIDGSVEVTRLQGGVVLGKEKYSNDTDLPYAEFQEKKKKLETPRSYSF